MEDLVSHFRFLRTRGCWSRSSGGAITVEPDGHARGAAPAAMALVSAGHPPPRLGAIPGSQPQVGCRKVCQVILISQTFKRGNPKAPTPHLAKLKTLMAKLGKVHTCAILSRCETLP